MSIFLMQRLVCYLWFRNLLQHFLCTNSDMYALQLCYLRSDTIDEMIASLEGNIVVVRALLEQSGENDNFGLSLMPNCQC